MGERPVEIWCLGCETHAIARVPTVGRPRVPAGWFVGVGPLGNWKYWGDLFFCSEICLARYRRAGRVEDVSGPAVP